MGGTMSVIFTGGLFTRVGSSVRHARARARVCYHYARAERLTRGSGDPRYEEDA